jgi:uncharacterized DUF497 family protein
MAGLIFEWDEDKARYNPEKHGIAFVGALALFEDPQRIERIDLCWDYGEERVQIIGWSKGRLLLGDRRWFHLRQVNRLLTIMEQAAW